MLKQITKEEAEQIALTTRNQIFSMASELKVFVKHIAFDKDGTLQVRFNNRKGANHVSVIYDYNNGLYNMEIHECRILNKDPFIINEKKNEISGVFFDQLADIIKHEIDFGGNY
jgi:hypothetical protein